MFAEIGDNCYIEPPLHANWGGKNVHFANGVYANFNLTLVDDCDIFVGDNVMFAPNVTITTGTHPIHPILRSKKANGVYANFNLTLVDDCDIFVGDNVMFAPNVTITTGTHPIHPILRSKKAQYNLPVHIGNNVWIGAGVTILPGVKIGDNTVIGAGSVVTKDIPANVVAIGSPCKVFRDINENDMKYYNKNMEIDIE